MNDMSKFGSLSIILLIVLSMSIGFAAAQYITEKTTIITIDSNGSFTANEPSLGVTYNIQGSPGSSGSVTATLYSDNPYPTAAKPQDCEMCNFIVVSFAMDSQDFDAATITFAYNDSDVAGILAPYKIYKYIPETNSYIEMPTTVDTEQKTLTIALTSTDDPVFAIGGTSVASQVPDYTSWITVAVVAIIVIVAVGLLVVYLFRSGRIG